MLRLSRFAPLALIVVLVLAGCGGGGGGTSSSMTSSQEMGSSATTSSPAAAPAGAPAAALPEAWVNGTVATGAPLVGATVTLTDSRRASTSASTDENGRYRCRVDGLVRPFLLHAQGNGHDMYSISHEGDVANITPVTDRLARLAAQAGATTPGGLFSSAGVHRMPTGAGMRTMSATMMAGMASALESVGLDPATFDPMGTPFSADHMGFDALLDHMQITADGLTLTHGGQTVTCAFALGQTDTSSPTMTMTVTTRNGEGPPTTTTRSMTVPMHAMHDGPMMDGSGMPGTGPMMDGSGMNGNGPMMGR